MFGNWVCARVCVCLCVCVCVCVCSQDGRTTCISDCFFRYVIELGPMLVNFVFIVWSSKLQCNDGSVLYVVLLL